MYTLYPSIKPLKKHKIQVDDIHTIYVTESGNVAGIPVLFLHGGPGNGCNDNSRRYFDPSCYYIITLDQRGCGHSVPHGSLINNDTNNLIMDIDKVRQYLKIGRWILLGDGWGGTLAMLYALQYPDNILAIITSGISLGRKQDIDWRYKNGGADKIFPDYWQDFVSKLSAKEQLNPLSAYYQRIVLESNELIKMSFAKDWGLWMTRCSTLRPNQQAIDAYLESHQIHGMASIATHYAMHNMFIAENFILANLAKINCFPGILVHGRYDMLSPVENSCLLHNNWASSECHIVRDAGHSLIESSIQDVLIRATNNLVNRFRGDFDFDSTS